MKHDSPVRYYLKPLYSKLVKVECHPLLCLQFPLYILF